MGGSPPPPVASTPEPDRWFHRCLVAVEAKPTGPRLRLVLQGLARGGGARFLVVHAVLRSTSVAGNELDGNPADQEEVALAQAIRREVMAWFGDAGRDVPVKILHGDPGQRICEYAEYLGCDLIVLEAGDPLTVAKRLRGSVRGYVAAHARCSVLTVGG